MRITQTNNALSFGKQALMTCIVKDKENNNLNSATLYKLEPDKESDKRDVYYSKQTYCIAPEFLNAQNSHNSKDFYLLQNDKTQEVIACAQTSHRLRQDPSSEIGQYTLIEEAHQNNKYAHGFSPLLAYIVHNSVNKHDNSIITAFDNEYSNKVNGKNFKTIQTGECYLSKKDFNHICSSSEEKYNIEYIV